MAHLGKTAGQTARKQTTLSPAGQSVDASSPRMADTRHLTDEQVRILGKILSQASDPKTVWTRKP